MRGGVLLKRRDDGGGNALSAVRRVDVDALDLEGLLVHALPRAAAGQAGKTQILLASEAERGTTVLNQDVNNIADTSERPKVELTILEQVVMIHTNEVIP